jgi:hypothetical protein
MSELVEASPPPPRLVGSVWLLYFLTAMVGALLVRGIVVPADITATARNILVHASLYRGGLAFDLISNLVYIALTALLFGLFKPVNPRLALLAALFGLVGCTVQIVGGLLRVAPLVILTNSQLTSGFSGQQVEGALLLSLTLYKSVFHISFVLFGCFEMVIGFLILRSTFLPRWLGWWWIIAGVAAVMFLWPPLATSIFPLILAADTAELGLLVWLMVKGVDNSKWRSLSSNVARRGADSF